MIDRWLRYYTSTTRGPMTGVTLPHNLKLAADGVTPEAPADWIQLPDGAGSTCTITNGAGEPVNLVATTQINTWAVEASAITACSGNVIAGTGQPALPMVDSSTAASAAASSATTAAASASTAAAAVTAFGLTPSATVITADPAPAVLGTFYDCDPSGGAFNISLPAAVQGKRIGINVVTTSAHAVTPVPNGTDTLPANLATVSGAYGRAVLMGDTSVSPHAWRLVGV